MPSPLSERSRLKRQDILEAATELFLDKGYANTSMDEVAAAAQASKQTVYKHFRDKETLFGEIVMSSVADVSSPFQALIAGLEDVEDGDVPVALHDLARRYIRAVMQPELLRRRQLVVREAGRHPELARAYHEGAPQQTIHGLARAFAALSARGALSIADPEVAAGHFAFLVLGQPLDTVMFRGADGLPSASALDTAADAGADVFLAAYRPHDGDHQTRGNVRRAAQA